MDQLNKNLNDYCYYFIRYFEEQIRYWRHILEENSDLKAKPVSKPVSILATLTSAIPTVGRGIGAGITEGEKYINNLIDKNKASSVSSIAYSSTDDKDLFRNILISGAFEVFIRFEYQFEKITCKNGGITRAMQKLGQDSANRLFTFLLNEESVNELTSELVEKGILFGESKRHKTKLVKLGRTLHSIENNLKLTTSDFFRNCGIRIKHDDVITYYKRKSSIEILGHRICFDFENVFEDDYEIESPKYSYKYILIDLDKKELLKNIRLYISKKDPLEDIKEFAKFSYEEQIKLLESASEERQNIRNEILQDNATKHIEVKESIESTQITITSTFENALAETKSLFMSETSKVLQKTEEISQDVANIKQKQEEGGNSIKINLEPIKEQTERLKNNIEREGKKVEKEIRRFRDRIGKLKF